MLPQPPGGAQHPQNPRRYGPVAHSRFSSPGWFPVTTARVSSVRHWLPSHTEAGHDIRFGVGDRPGSAVCRQELVKGFKSLTESAAMTVRTS